MPTSRSLRIFLSSTDVDLHAYRTKLIDAISKLDQQAIDMRYFGAQAERTATTVSLDYVDQADVVILMVAWRYGTLDAQLGKSITQLEFEYAVGHHLPIFVFLAHSDTQDVNGPYGTLFPAEQRNPATETQLLALRDILTAEGRVVDFFRTPDDLALCATTALSKYLIDRAEQGQLQAAVPRNLPARTPNFVGRKAELVQIDAELRSGHSALIATAIAGLGGVGKSALAAEVLQQIAQDALAFPGGISWLPCNDRTGLDGLNSLYDQLLAEWGIRVGPEDLAGTTTAKEAAERRERLIRSRWPTTDPALLLLDNVERDLPLARLLNALGAKKIRALVTTRTLFAAPSLALHRLDVLAPEEAVTLLRDRYQAKGGAWEEARDRVIGLGVVETLGHLPLAIDLAAARAARQGMRINRLHAELREPDTLAKLQDPTDPQASVRYSLERSLDLLTVPQRACFAALGMVGSTDYPHTVVLDLFAEILPAPGQAAETVDLLLTLSLATPAERAGMQRLRVHPLVHDLAHDAWQQMAAPLQQQAGQGLVTGVARFVDAHEHAFAVLAQDELLVMQTIAQADHLGASREAIIDLTWAISAYLDLQGRWQSYREVMQVRLRLYRELGDRAGEGRTLGNLGTLARAQGQYADAARYYAESLAIKRDIGDRAGEGVTLGNLGILAREQGQYADAARYYAESLAIARAIGDRATEGAALGNLGILAREQGQHADAARYYAESLAIARAIGDRAGEGAALGNLGILALEQGQHADAARYYAEDLAIARAIGDRAGEGQTLGNLGTLARAQGQYADAARYYAESLAIKRDIGDRAGEGRTLGTLGTLARAQGQYADAARYYAESLAIARAIGDQAGEGQTLGGLGTLALDQGQYADAARYYAESLAIARAIGDRATEGAALGTLGTLALDQGQYADAARYYAESLAIKRDIGDRTGEGRTLGTLGTLARDQGQYADATRYYAESLAILGPMGAVEAKTVQQNLEALQEHMKASQSAPQGKKRQWFWQRRNDDA